jgi:hypothetical protein
MGRKVLVVAGGDLEADRPAEHPLEGRDVAMRSPELELRVTGRPQACEIVVPPRIEIDAGERL